jgi:hypothetical protein
MAVATPHFTDPDLLEALDAVAVTVPRGEPRRQLADLVDALATRARAHEVEAKLATVADALWDEEVRLRVEEVLAERDAEPAGLEAPADRNSAALALAYRAALPPLARDERVQAPLKDLELSFAELDEEDRERFGPVLARAAVPAVGLDLELMKDEGYHYVAVFPPEGSEGVDIVGKASKWLTKRMTMDREGPRTAMRRFLAILAEEVEVELPVVAETLDRLLAEPAPTSPANDRMFVALARGLVEEAVAERGFPF